MKQSITFLTLMMLLAGSVNAQEDNQKLWTLGDCINYAFEKNIQLQQKIIAQQQSNIDVETAKCALFPNLSFNTSQNLVNRPYSNQSSIISGSDVISSNNKTTYSGNYGLSTRMTIWNGNKLSNNIRQQKINSQIAGLDVSETKNSLQEQITQLYVQILYANESVQINKNTLEISTAQYERGVQLLNAGSLSKADVAQLAAQVSSDRYQVVSAESQLDNYKLQLKQLLELGNDQELNVVCPNLDDYKVLSILPDKNEIFAAAIESRPEIESGKLSVQNSELGVSLAKAGYFPSLSLSASSSTNHVSSSDEEFKNQLKYGWNNTVGVNLSVPIFSNRETKSAVEKAKLQKDYYELELVNRQKNLYKEIESMWLDAKNAQEQFNAAKLKLESNQTSFDMVNEQFSLGMKNIVDLLTVKNNLLSAQQGKIQAKYMAILNRTMLEFYAGANPAELIY